ncbi:MAG: Wzz/FepE/Etk N-terminal domain-containing protein, partial [Desulfobulbaceae bacterium]|nr:Wzz/FepE/Etk N-terminal domain-containing protein [Desulfobulbaceae bacterium]
MEAHDTEMNFNDLLAVVRRRKWSLLLPACLVFWVAAAVAILLPPVYRSTATILIEGQEIPSDLVQTTVTSFAQQRLQAIFQRIVSTSRLVEIINRLQLYDDLRKTMPVDQIAAKMREDILLDFINAEVIDPRTGRPSSAAIAFTLSYDGKNPGMTQQVASVLTSLFLEENLKEREKSARGASSFLEEEVAMLQEQMAAINAKIATYKEQHVNELPELLQVNMQSLQQIEMSQDRLAEQLRSLREREGALQAQLASTSPQQEQVQKNRLAELKVQLTNLQSRFSARHPDVIAVKDEIAKLTRQGEGGGGAGATTPDNPAYISLQSQLASTRSEIDSVQKQVAVNDRNAAQYRRGIAATPKVEEGYRAMINERDNLQLQYNQMRQKHMGAEVAQGLEKEQKGERFTLVEPPLLPEKPEKPNRLAIALIGIVLGLGAGVGTAALREFSDQSFHSAEALAGATALPVLVVVPEIVSAAEMGRRKRHGVFAVSGLLLVTAAVGAVLLKVMLA